MSRFLLLFMVGALAPYSVPYSVSLAMQPAPRPRVEIGPVAITTAQYFSITLHNPDKPITSYEAFPEIKGLAKRSISSGTQIQFRNGRRQERHSITQYYLPLAAGVYQMPALALRVNGQLARHAGVTLTVQATTATPHKPSFSQGTSPFDQFFNLSPSTPPEDEVFIEVNDEAFFSLSVNKKEVFVGEPFTLTLAFYVSGKNRASMEFYDLESQLTDIINRVTPKACWEENLRFSLPKPEYVTLGGERYAQRILYQSVFYPLEDSPIVFPAVGLKMVKYKVSNTPSLWGRRTQTDYKTFYTKARRLKVKPLPPHPLSEQVAVGRYALREKKKKQEILPTGQGTDYQMVIRGEGNISALPAPFMRPHKGLEMYEPRIEQQIERGAGRVVGEKSFTYHIIGQAPGRYPLAERLMWIYFDPTRVRYDTLRPTRTLDIEGKIQANLQVESNRKDQFYAKAFQPSSPNSIAQHAVVLMLENKYVMRFVVLAGMVLGLFLLFFRR